MDSYDMYQILVYYCEKKVKTDLVARMLLSSLSEK